MGEMRRAQLASIEGLLADALDEICDAANIARDAGETELSTAILAASKQVRSAIITAQTTHAAMFPNGEGDGDCHQRS